MTTTVRMDDDLKRSCDEVLDDMGLNFSVAVVAFAKELVRRRAMPFELRAGRLTPRHTRREALHCFETLRREAEELPEMSLDEINAEIAAARAERKARRERASV